MRRALLVAAVAGIAGSQNSAGAYEVESALSDPCHERATLTAAIEAGVDGATFADVPIPRDDTWEELQPLWRIHVPGSLERAQAFVLHSMYVGTRSPDTGGQSVANPRNARIWHRAQGDNPHCTRKPEDDGVVDDRVAARCRDVVREEIGKMAAALALEPGHQIGRVPFTIDFYGEIEVDVWLPGYHLGRALHSVQDSFAHSIRSDDVQRIWHVLNFDDALTAEYDEERDGLRHSGGLDHCDGSTDPIYQTAIEASSELIASLIAADGDAFEDPGAATIDPLLERWMSYEPGCGYAEGYCDSPWLALAHVEPTEPFLGGCGVSRGRPRLGGAIALAMLTLLGLRRRSAHGATSHARIRTNVSRAPATIASAVASSDA